MCAASPSLKLNYPNTRSFASGFRLNDKDFLNLQALASKDSVQLSKLTEAEKKYIEKYIRANAARYYWDDNAYFEMLNEDDSDIKKALELLK